MSEKKSKNILKEKFITIYETFFKAEDFSAKPASFWDELFLLKVNSNYIINEFKNLSTNEEIIRLKKNINFLYNKAIDFLKFETNTIRLHNIIHTLYLFTYSISITKQIRLNSIETLEFLVGIDNAELKFQTIFDTIYGILTSDESPNLIKAITFKYLLTLVTQVENVNDNLFMEYFMLNNTLFDAIIQIVSDPSSRSAHGRDALLLLTVLLQYRKYDSENPYIVRLSILDDEMALTGIAQVMSSVFAEYNRVYSSSRREHEGESSWWNNVGTLIGNMFIGDEERRRLFNLDDSILLVFYESVHLNRNFISTLTHAATEFSTATSQSGESVDASSPSSAANDSNSKAAAASNATTLISVSTVVNPSDISMSMAAAAGARDTTGTGVAGSGGAGTMRLLSPLSLSIPANSTGVMPSAASLTPNNASNNQQVSDDAEAGALIQQQLLQLQQAANPPSNLLVIFLQACSAILQETKMDNSTTHDTVKLFMLVLVCISEDQYANSLLHDSNVLYSVFLYQAVSNNRNMLLSKLLKKDQNEDQ